MTDKFIAAGGTYFDTAYVYDNGASEAAFKAAVADRYPREAYTICTKLNAWNQCHDEKSAKQQFYTSLERTGAGYFDYYLLHAIQRKNAGKYDEYHIWDFVAEKKKEGQIKQYGLKTGDVVDCTVRPPFENEKYFARAWLMRIVEMYSPGEMERFVVKTRQNVDLLIPATLARSDSVMLSL